MDRASRADSRGLPTGWSSTTGECIGCSGARTQSVSHTRAYTRTRTRTRSYFTEVRKKIVEHNGDPELLVMDTDACIFQDEGFR